RNRKVFNQKETEYRLIICPCPKRNLWARALKYPEGRTYSPPEKPLREFSGGGILTGVRIVRSARLCGFFEA
ncbi:MAG: hypothetical protein IKE65_07485, partial [Clostridia bacterium]|nr:hypothetical protein [Clostridia bacterium]